MTGEPVQIQGAGRTDAGVHARGQAASVRMKTDRSCCEIQEYLNRYLPEDIAVLSVEQAPERFHARLNAAGKRYRYQLAFGGRKPVFDRKYLYRVEEPLDFQAMRQAAGYLAGSHDFRSFCSLRRMKKSTVRTLFGIEILEDREQERADLIFEGNGFLYHMVRILTGTLLEIGTGKRDASKLPVVIAAEDRSLAGFLAPARGLFLRKVYY